MADDAKTVEKAARELIDRHGADTLPILRERAKLAEELKDQFAAKAWQDIADAAERILKTDREHG